MRKTLLLLASLLVATTAHAAGGKENTTEYYSDATKTKLVGEVIVGCGMHGRWGKTTVFLEHVSSPCGDARVNTATSIAASALMHYDPIAACKRRCLRIPFKSCPPPSANEPECVQPREACSAACDELLTPLE